MSGATTMASAEIYDPAANRWTLVPQPPLRAAASTSIAWTGRTLLAFGGVLGSSPATHNKQVWLHGVAGFAPAKP